MTENQHLQLVNTFNLDEDEMLAITSPFKTTLETERSGFVIGLFIKRAMKHQATDIEKIFNSAQRSEGSHLDV
ncbi:MULTISPECIES: hypothetical protein [unclassified Prochlorococcus]|uniref:hypothetical protein n=1 Tax=unclassified Prochlorococcus TaxID=2627481 RepID=UPI00053370F3|nr:MULTISPECIES: hypothetical protein [unclassified Prochlorococcus]KGG28806.1 hypothetical protein EV12_0434 [Prochlorococcus sp. MIT 0701]KGG29727.1 hypothetical protein EV13_0945 [Prochlorococcus sp. MIT 0702]KGG34282.1 hypothetical protein EV14_1376 [Prochlorococcus sp. MIT 0703]